MTAVRALCVPSASGHENRGLPKTTSPENPWSSAEDRGFEPLEQAAIHEHAPVVDFEQVLRAGDRARGTEEGQ